MGRKILDQNRDVLDTAAELFRKQIQGLFCKRNEILALHHLPPAQAVHLHRVASIVLLIVVTFIASTVSFIFIFLFVLFLVWLSPKKDIGSFRAIRTLCFEALWAYSVHVHMVLYARGQEQRVLSGA